MTTPSFKQMVAQKQIKRADAYKVRLQDIHEEPGFNLRLEGPDLAASIEAIADHIATGGLLPALEVRPRTEGGVWLVDGHRRRRALLLAVERGVPLQSPKDGDVWIEVKQFEGNDAERVARIITSAEGRSLQPIETAEGYRRLRAFGWTNEQIAKKVGKTGTHVAQLLTLSNANSDVKKRVAEGSVPASIAVKAVRAHGDDAGAYLEEQLSKANSVGKKKVTAGTIAGKRAPMSMYRALYDACCLAGAFDQLPDVVKVAANALRGYETPQEHSGDA